MIRPTPAFPTNPGPIVGAGNTILTHTRTAPQANYTVSGWSQPLLMLINRVRVVDGDAVTVSYQFKTQGFLTPTGQKLSFKFEGERSWQHYNLYCLNDPELKNNDQVVIDNVTYRVTYKWSWTQFGYLKYKLTEDYSSATET